MHDGGSSEQYHVGTRAQDQSRADGISTAAGAPVKRNVHKGSKSKLKGRDMKEMRTVNNVEILSSREVECFACRRLLWR